MLVHILYTILLAVLYALVEIQIEGKAGWARHLPTFRINVFFRKFLGGKPLTGYHIFMLMTFVVVFHAMMHNEMSWRNEIQIFGLLNWFFVIEEISWFILNPHYTLQKFLDKDIRWHKRWLWGLPVSYWIGILLGTWGLYLGR